VIVPLSGANAQFGINSGNDIELVADEINTTGWIKELGGAKINLIVADSTSTPTTAGTVAQRLIKQEVVVAILGGRAVSRKISNRSDHHEINYARRSCSPPWQRQDVPLLQVVAKARHGAGQGLASILDWPAQLSTLHRNSTSVIAFRHRRKSFP